MHVLEIQRVLKPYACKEGAYRETVTHEHAGRRSHTVTHGHTPELGFANSVLEVTDDAMMMMAMMMRMVMTMMRMVMMVTSQR